MCLRSSACVRLHLRASTYVCMRLRASACVCVRASAHRKLNIRTRLDAKGSLRPDVLYTNNYKASTLQQAQGFRLVTPDRFRVGSGNETMRLIAYFCITSVMLVSSPDTKLFACALLALLKNRVRTRSLVA